MHICVFSSRSSKFIRLTLNIRALVKHFEAFNYFQKHLVLCLSHSENVWDSGKRVGDKEKSWAMEKRPGSLHSMTLKGKGMVF